MVKKPLCKCCGDNDENNFKYGRKYICNECRKAQKRLGAKRLYIERMKDPIKRKQINTINYELRQRNIVNFMKRLFDKIKQKYKVKNNIKCFYNILLSYLLKLWNDQDGKCSVTNIKMSHCYNSINSVSIDRIDNSIGYVVGNIRLVCKWVNLGRLDNDVNDFNFVLSNLIQNNYEYFEYDDKDIRENLSSLYKGIQSRCCIIKSKNGLKTKNYDITLNFLCYLYKKQNSKCSITGFPLLIEKCKLNSCSVDRIDNLQGYIKNNVHLVCKWVNTARGKHSINELKNMIDLYRKNS